MHVLEELKAVKELIKDEFNWCKGTFAKNKFGTPVQPHSRDACKFCVNGAIRKVTGVAYGNPAYAPIRQVIGGDIALWNDHPETTHADVIEVLDKAIARAGAL